MVAAPPVAPELSNREGIECLVVVIIINDVVRFVAARFPAGEQVESGDDCLPKRFFAYSTQTSCRSIAQDAAFVRGAIQRDI